MKEPRGLLALGIVIGLAFMVVLMELVNQDLTQRLKMLEAASTKTSNFISRMESCAHGVVVLVPGDGLIIPGSQQTTARICQP